MAHFAKIEDGIVTDVITISNQDIDFLEFPESEPVGQTYIASVGIEGIWLQTSYNTFNGYNPNGNPFRYTYAGIGYLYVASIDSFIPPSPYPSWSLNLETKQWQAPIPYPADPGDDVYIWDESSQQWVDNGTNPLPPPVPQPPPEPPPVPGPYPPEPDTHQHPPLPT